MKKYFAYLKRPKVYIPLVVVLIILFLLYRNSHNSTVNFTVSPADIGNVVERVSVTGTVSPVGKADLSFEKSGVVSSINVKVGDKVYRGQAIASLDNAGDAAALQSAQATLDDMSRSLTPQELAVQKTAVVNAQNDALNAAHDSFVKAQGAVFSYADTFFTNPQSSNPAISLYTQSDFVLRTAINNERMAVSEAFRLWSLDLGSASASSASSIISSSQSHLQVIKKFFSDLAVITNTLTPGGAGLTQAQINTDVASANLGLTNINSAIDAVAAAQTGLSTAQSNYDLRLSGNSAESIAAQAAKVAQARASLAEDTVISPLDGLVTIVDPNVGEFVTAGKASFGVESSGEYKIEAYVPEADIAKIAVGNVGSTTLDAYGSNTFFGVTATSIDPAETVKEGVPTYKVTLLFTTPDNRIRSGMTANLEINTHERDNVLAIPYRALSITATSTTVRIVNPDGKTYIAVPVTTGLKGSDGTIEIISGLKVGDKVVTYVKS